MHNKNCDNCKFAVCLTVLYTENLDNQDGIKSLQEFCTNFFKYFFALLSFIRSFGSIEQKIILLAMKIEELNEKLDSGLSTWKRDFS